MHCERISSMQIHVLRISPPSLRGGLPRPWEDFFYILHWPHFDSPLPSTLNRLENLCKNTSTVCFQIRNILEKSGALEESKQLCEHHGNEALKALSMFEHSEARHALQNIVKATQTI